MMNSAFEQMNEFQRRSADLPRQCAKLMLDSSAELMRCYLEAAERFCRIGTRFCLAETKEMCEIAGNPSVSESVERFSSLVNTNLQGAAQFTQACVESAAGLQQPLVKIVEDQMPVISEPILAGMEQLADALGNGGKPIRKHLAGHSTSHSPRAAA